MSKQVLTYIDAKEFAYIIDSVSVIVEEASFVLRQDGLHLRALDVSRTAMVDLSIPKEAFEEFPEVDELRFGFNFKDLKKLLRRVKKGDKISIEFEEGRARIKLIGKATRSITVPSIEILSEDLPTPKVVYTAMVKTASDVLASAVKDADAVADEAKFDASEEALVISASSDKGEVEVRLDKNSELVYEFDVKEPASARFSLEYLLDITSKTSKISDMVTIELATAKPLLLTFDIPAGGRISYYIAPRVE
ncbi:MAG: proliferating cell nuclear antigen (pcna) [Pyrobaculum sp.]|uniref:DNA polymerase sliding clamp n=3 Tax=Pyrobaculum TaxID=2276 RepID=A4WLS2_PYRAR|nr:proliferating cell nuclear antigen (pcna) [Pyrobaculum arsenaticum]ABP51339.1 monomeric archaeal DNA polymerase sliding clamp [Pyrobaculum arsenaticum DSM 13514]AFA38370.1 proliferating cell nuclear antigen (pcna) [Pyrobaculum oguniense TE7]MCY0889432.1 proliferating cell nuclear antigen (pcna) [Pyrobaculum arsenaticum]NYR16291.1 proliferating cell nuclear antigen (pcna) [Pyrobaculum arsenaticum]